MSVFDEKSDIEFQNETYVQLIENLQKENELLKQQIKIKERLIETKDRIISNYEDMVNPKHTETNNESSIWDDLIGNNYRTALRRYGEISYVNPSKRYKDTIWYDSK